MKLEEFSDIIAVPDVLREFEISGITNDSRVVQPGDLFVAIPGFKSDGLQFANEAISRGAAALLTVEEALTPPGVPVLTSANIRRDQGLVAAKLFGDPSRKLRVIGVTGTNGKTTVVHLIEHILLASGIATGLIGTVWIDTGDERIASRRTTPDSIELQRLFSKMVTSQMDTVVMEVSSHALALERTAGIEFDAAVMTNVTHDHFDFHQNFPNYLSAKQRLFNSMSLKGKKPKYAVLNGDDPHVSDFLAHCTVPVIIYGSAENADIRIKNISGGMERRLEVEIFGEECLIRTRLPGFFNVSNIMAAVAVAFREGCDLETIEMAVPEFPGVPGRYQELRLGQPFRIMVDFAHNPDALDKILNMAGEASQGRRILVFGCEGEKDRLKRPIMGKIASKNSEIPILTSDNLYTEDLNCIVDDVLKSLDTSERSKIIVEPDRRRAIEKAINMARPGDFVIVAGKGHEDYLVSGKQQIHFNDAEVIQEILEERNPS